MIFGPYGYQGRYEFRNFFDRRKVLAISGANAGKYVDESSLLYSDGSVASATDVLAAGYFLSSPTGLSLFYPFVMGERPVDASGWDAPVSFREYTGPFGIAATVPSTTGSSGSVALSGVASTADLRGWLMYIHSGLGAGQTPRTIISWTSGVAGVTPNWATSPDTTSVIFLVPFSQPYLQTAQGFNTSGQSDNLPVDVKKVAGQTALASATVTFPASIGDASATSLAALAGKFSGITSLTAWLRAAWRKSAPDATALSEINSGGGTYNAATDSLEASEEQQTQDTTNLLSALGNVPGLVWVYSARTLTSFGSLITSLVTALLSALAGTSRIVVVSPATGDSITIFRGDSYVSDEGTAIPFFKTSADTHWPTQLDSVHFTCKPTPDLLEVASTAASLTDIECTVDTDTGDNQAFTLELTSEQTAQLSIDPRIRAGYSFWFIANKDDEPHTLSSGPLTVLSGP